MRVHIPRLFLQCSFLIKSPGLRGSRVIFAIVPEFDHAGRRFWRICSRAEKGTIMPACCSFRRQLFLIPAWLALGGATVVLTGSDQSCDLSLTLPQ